MKKLFILIFMVSLVSCSKDQEKENKTLNGNYSLTEARCFCAFESDMNLVVINLISPKKTIL